jgi:hypothetical protein
MRTHPTQVPFLLPPFLVARYPPPPRVDAAANSAAAAAAANFAAVAAAAVAQTMNDMERRGMNPDMRLQGDYFGGPAPVLPPTPTPPTHPPTHPLPPPYLTPAGPCDITSTPARAGRGWPSAGLAWLSDIPPDSMGGLCAA